MSVELIEGFYWLHGDYMITTDSARAAETGIGYFTVSMIERTGYPDLTLIYLDKALSRADAVTMIRFHEQQLKEGKK